MFCANSTFWENRTFWLRQMISLLMLGYLFNTMDCRDWEGPCNMYWLLGRHSQQPSPCLKWTFQMQKKLRFTLTTNPKKCSSPPSQIKKKGPFSTHTSRACCLRSSNSTETFFPAKDFFAATEQCKTAVFGARCKTWSKLAIAGVSSKPDVDYSAHVNHKGRPVLLLNVQFPHVFFHGW